MTHIDDVIAKLHLLTDLQRTIWHSNAARVIAKGARRSAAYTNALRLHQAITDFESTRPAEAELIAASGLDWDHAIKERATFRGFHGHHLVARVTRVKPTSVSVTLDGATLPCTYTTLSAARAAAALAALRTPPGPLA